MRLLEQRVHGICREKVNQSCTEVTMDYNKRLSWICVTFLSEQRIAEQKPIINGSEPM